MARMLEIDPRAKALIFDIDGTLVDTMEIHYQAWEALAQEEGFHYPRELFYELAGVPTRKLIPLLNERLGLSLHVEDIQRRKEDLYLARMSEMKEIAPVADIARRYHGRLPMSLGTGGRRDIAKLTLASVGLDRYFEIMVAMEDVEHHKPAPDTFLRCAELMGVAPEFCQVFEDGELGLEAARRAGMIATDIRDYL
ncbi:MAG: Fructose-1-phosphate phosphatase YqaB [bacterium ADurb.Bin429]|nr:MAG: Fructose-1-phosphate phosphatase YqaB [bacterium ADurb.Bin429]